MNTKIVYSVVSDNTDYYLDQTLLSVYSLRLYNKDVNVTLVVDTITEGTIKGNRKEILNYVDKIIPISVPSNYNKVQRSRYLKTTLREYIKGAYLFIDSDTLITGKIDEIDYWDFIIGATADKHVPIAIHPMKRFIYENSKKVGFKILDGDYYWNSGVLFVKDTLLTHDFYKRWNSVWAANTFKGINSDQASLAKVNEEFNYIISDIGGIWNCQLTDNGLRFFTESKIIHYFASTAKKRIISPYNYYQTDIYNKIRLEGHLTSEIKQIIQNPKEQFTNICRIVSKEDIDYLDSALHHLYLDHKITYHIILFIARICLKMLNYKI